MMITLIILNLNICIFITENLRQCNAMETQKLRTEEH